MPQVICPRCGATNDTRAADYPFCVGCQDNLARCGYCRWFDAGPGLCTHPIVAGIFEVSESATPPCVYHDPRSQLIARGRWVRAALWTGVAAAAVLLLGLVMLSFQPPLPAQVDLQLAVEANYAGVVQGKPFPVTALVSNTSDAPVSDVRVEIAKRSLEVFDLLTVKPPANAIRDRGKWRVVSYPTLRPGETRRIVITLVPKKTGTLHVMLRLVSGGNIYHGLSDLPVIVEANPGREQSSTKRERQR